jgi:hypothetical protein
LVLLRSTQKVNCCMHCPVEYSQCPQAKDPSDPSSSLHVMGRCGLSGESVMLCESLLSAVRVRENLAVSKLPAGSWVNKEVSRRKGGPLVFSILTSTLPLSHKNHDRLHIGSYSNVSYVSTKRHTSLRKTDVNVQFTVLYIK